MRLKFEVSKAKGAVKGSFGELDGEIRKYDDATAKYLLEYIHGYELVEEEKAVEERSTKPARVKGKK